MIDAAAAVIVIGSTAKGTMSPRSKIVFADIEQAQAFIAAHGGETAPFTSALDVARAGVSGENTMLVIKSDADSFAGPRGGIILLFGEVTIEKIFNR